MLISTTFLAQNHRLSSQSLRASTHDNARVATERLGTELRSMMDDGLVAAAANELTVRSPMAVLMVCSRSGNDLDVYLDGGESALDTDEVAGLAMRDSATGAWEYVNTGWGSLDGGPTGSATRCEANGADTTAATSEFHQLLNAGALFATTPDPGDILMLFRETTFRIETSVLQPNTLGIFRQPYGGSLVEFATGMDSTAQFQYRTGGSTYADAVTGSSLGDVDAVRIVADARLPAQSASLEDATFGWSVNVLLRNVP